MAEGCGYKNSYTRCKAGWIYEPDGYGCVQSALCPVCDGRGYGEDKSVRHSGPTPPEATRHIVFAADCKPCEMCGELICPMCDEHYAECPCPGPHSEEREYTE